MRTLYVAVLLLVAVASSAPTSAAPCAGFDDVDDASPFCVNVAWMKNRGITFGLTPTLYDPGSPVTRLQMAAFMYRLGFQNAFLQGGNAFGTTAVLGTTDLEAFEVHVGGLRRMRLDGSNIVGGTFNSASGSNNVVAGGGGAGTCFPPSRPARPCINVAGFQPHASIGGGAANLSSGGGSTISGGFGNLASGTSATVAGGAGNVASGIDSMAAGGHANNATGRRTFAAGSSANAAHDGCFVWGDATNDSLTSCFGANEFVARAVGGFYFWTSGFDDNSYSGARLESGTGAWAAYSDANGKDALELVDMRDVLERLVRMPISRWQWKAEAGGVKHMGPTAQDFRAAFGLGNSDKQIVTVDADGVALAAIQGLNAKLEAEVVELRAELAEIRALLNATRR